MISYITIFESFVHTKVKSTIFSVGYFGHFLFTYLGVTAKQTCKEVLTKDLAGIWTRAFWVAACYPCLRTTQDFLYISWKVRGFKWNFEVCLAVTPKYVKRKWPKDPTENIVDFNLSCRNIFLYYITITLMHLLLYSQSSSYTKKVVCWKLKNT